MADRINIDDLNRNENLETDPNANLSHSEAGFFEIRVKGQLDSHWSEWLEGLEVRVLESGETILFGQIVDQAALLGVLNKLSRLNLAILSVNEVKRAY
jgi:hypothetical protein